MRTARKVAALQNRGRMASALDPDIVRMSFVSLAMTPMLLKDIFEEKMERSMDAEFLAELANFNGRSFAAGLAPYTQVKRETDDAFSEK